MVKSLDDTELVPIDHVGVRLWRLARAWKTEFETEMVRRGHAWMTEARGTLLGHLRGGGIAQSELAGRLAVSKQAVQQFVDELAAEGIVERLLDPNDRRGRLVRFTAKGRQSVKEADEVKRAIEQGYRRRLGEKRFAILMEALDDLVDDDRGN